MISSPLLNLQRTSGHSDAHQYAFHICQIWSHVEGPVPCRPSKFFGCVARYKILFYTGETYKDQISFRTVVGKRTDVDSATLICGSWEIHRKRENIKTER